MSEDMNMENNQDIEAENDIITEEKELKPAKKSIGREIFEWFYTIIIAIAIALVIKGFLFDIVKVDGRSMLPTLIHNDRLIVTKLGYTPEQGDIVILDSNYTKREGHFENLTEQGHEPGFFKKLSTRYFGNSAYKELYYVKRIVALPGQTVDVRNGKIYVDGEIYEDGYHQGNTYVTSQAIKYPHTVGEECVFVLGDNREHSTDSRIIGDVPYDALLGKAQIRIWPLNNLGSVY